MELMAMAERMVEKYNKYWGNIEKANSLIYVADILDSRHKLKYTVFAIEELYGKDKSEKMIKKAKDDLEMLFDEYNRLYGSPLNNNGSNNNITTELNLGKEDAQTQVVNLRFKKHKYETNAGESKSELEKYLKDNLENDVSDFDLLRWWKLNAPRFPILSHMARDVLALPVSTVASESTFSTSGRILDAFRSSLTPKIAQALICTQDWLRSTFPVGVEENLEMLDQLEEEFSKIGLENVAAPTNN
ncbi:zinc finger BED domain-containing protein RICESLEEPER 2-like isoform X1 [Carex rostrata]